MCHTYVMNWKSLTADIFVAWIPCDFIVSTVFPNFLPDNYTDVKLFDS